MPKEKPILFSTEMVKAILDGRKTVTRRVIKDQPASTEMCPIQICKDVQAPSGYSFFSDMIGTIPIKAPYKVGDLLWVREGWRCTGGGDDRNIIYKVEGDTALSFCGIDDGRTSILHVPEPYWDQWDKLVYETRKSCEWRSPLFMFKWAARLWLEVLDVRPERLQDITEEDAIAEGIRLYEYGTEYDKDYGGREKNMNYSVGYGTERLALGAMPNTARGGFRRLWNSLNDKPKPIYKTVNGKKQIIGYVSYPWEDVQEEREYRGKVWHVIGNPLVLRYEFKRVNR